MRTVYKCDYSRSEWSAGVCIYYTHSVTRHLLATSVESVAGRLKQLAGISGTVTHEDSDAWW